jgi:hypothetical protein
VSNLLNPVSDLLEKFLGLLFRVQIPKVDEQKYNDAVSVEAIHVERDSRVEAEFREKGEGGYAKGEKEGAHGRLLSQQSLYPSIPFSYLGEQSARASERGRMTHYRTASSQRTMTQARHTCVRVCVSGQGVSHPPLYIITGSHHFI